MMKKIPYIIAVILSLAGCGGGRRAAFTADGLDTLYRPQYAAGFAVLSAGGQSSILSITDPWQGARDVEIRLFLSRGGEQAPDGFDGVAVDAPLKSVVCMSSSYVAMLDAIGETDAVKAVSGARYITNPVIRGRYDSGEVREAGYDAYVNYEMLATLNPDLVLIYGISGENSQMTGKLDELGIKYIYIGDYVEQSPLGKAEWLVAFGEMFDKRAQAEEIFAGIRDEYNGTKKLAEEYARFLADASGSGDHTKPAVMLNAPYRDTWYVPGDRSYMVRLLEDAGAAYACAGEDTDVSRPLSGESAYVFAARSDFWLNPGQAETLAEVKSQNPKFADIPAVAEGRVWNNNARTTPDGGSDFWESGAVRPDIVLKDLVKIFYPALLPDHEPYYFHRMR